MIGKLERVPLREIWRHEALDFTRWLQENLDVLSDSLDIVLSSAEREQSAGSFSVDLVAEDANGEPVIIESQLEKSNHDHLGKIITYLTAVDAKAAIWIVSDPRPEHVRAITWLNESVTADFYMVKLEGIKIGDSEPAPLLTLIVGPSEETRGIMTTREDIKERHILREKFWTTLLDRAKPKTRLHAGISPSRSSYISTGAGISGLTFAYVIRQHDCQAELYVDRGEAQENKAIFDKFAACKSEIEESFGEPLIWERLDGKRACRISKRIETGGYRDSQDKWAQTQDALIETMIRLEKAFRTHIDNMRI